jgi:uncharacterized coiled-coil protein SlyX|tara:strand:- start:132 stop:338 length:207 start_codon:yes stop_codon:yes gene_type:complete
MNENILDRLNDIESKYLFQEDTLERLSIELRKQQKEIQDLKEQVTLLKESLLAISSKEEIKDEKPPHY